MQATTVTLAVDAENDGGTLTNEVYSKYEEYQNRSLYIGADHALDERNTIGLYRTFPTRSGNFKGTAKSSVKFTQDFNVAGVDSSTTITAPVIVEVSFSVPVGVAQADLVHMRQRAIALLDSDSVMNSLNLQLMI
jgi:hypothetical protein